MSCNNYGRLIEKKITYKEADVENCIGFLINKSKEYDQRYQLREFQNATELSQKIQNIWIMENIYSRIKELFPNKYSIPELENHKLMNKFVDLKENLMGQGSMMGLSGKESVSQKKLVCESSIHKKENDDKPVSLCKICGASRCSVDMPLHMKEKHSTFIAEPKLKCKSPHHKKENDDKPVTLCKYCGQPRCSADMVPHILTTHKAELSKEEEEKLKSQLPVVLKSV